MIINQIPFLIIFSSLKRKLRELYTILYTTVDNFGDKVSYLWISIE